MGRFCAGDWQIPNKSRRISQCARRCRQDPGYTANIRRGRRSTLFKIDGYNHLAGAIVERFGMIPAREDQPDEPADFIAFPYDWRLDNRLAAARLKDVLDHRLAIWRRSTGARDAKAILVAHSMGGLVARYYIECLQGWRDTRALISYGTPYRGSVNALDTLANGTGKFGITFDSFTKLARWSASVHQLLPIYKVLFADRQLQRVAEAGEIPGVDATLASDSLRFHRDIEEAAEKNSQIPDYRAAYTVVPVVGTRQKTNQSARLSGGKIEVARDLPEGLPSFFADGDGTVPRASAVPIGMEKAPQVVYLKGKHAALHNSEQEVLLDRIGQMRVTGWDAIRGTAENAEEAEQQARQEQEESLARTGITLDLEDVYVSSEPVTISARIVDSTASPDHLEASIEGPAIHSFRMVKTNGGYYLETSDLPVGVYRIRVQVPGGGGAVPVRDVFAVAG